MHSDFSRWVPTKQNCWNWTAWNTEAVRALGMLHRTHYIGMDSGVHQKYGKLMYKQLEAPVSELTMNEVT